MCDSSEAHQATLHCLTLLLLNKRFHEFLLATSAVYKIIAAFFVPLQALLQGLDAGRPRLMADVRRLMTEAERLTVSHICVIWP